MKVFCKGKTSNGTVMVSTNVRLWYFSSFCKSKNNNSKIVLQIPFKSGEIKEDPTIKVVSPKMSKKLPVFVEIGQMRQLLDDLDFLMIMLAYVIS